MHLARIVTASCTVALVAGCAASSEKPRSASGEGQDVVVTATRVDDGRLAPPPPPPPPPPAALAYAPAKGAAMQERYARTYVRPVIVPVPAGTERYDGKAVGAVHIARTDPVSTFSVDVDTGAYANARRFLGLGQMPPRDAVRSEEMINYFRYDYATPITRDTPFTVTTDVAVTPWNPATRLMRIGLRGYDLASAGARPPANLVFLVDVSGSMSSEDKLPLVKTALSGLAGELSAKDRVSIVVYAGAAGLVLEPTNDESKIKAALDRLNAGGSTAGGAGLQLAYNIARDNFIKGGVNRILLATDGDFNVGVSDNKALIEMVERERDSGITLTTLGFGTGNYNEAMMEQIADHGNGNYAYIDSALEAKKVLGDQMSSTLFTIAKDVKIQVEFNPAQVSQYRLLGYENRALREEDFDNDKVDAGDIGAGHQVTAIYEIVPAGAQGWIGPRRYEEAAAATAVGKAGELAFVKLRYKLPDGTTSRLIERPVPARLLQASARPTGDFAFATAVAAFGQTLRGDAMMNGFTPAQIVSLAGRQQDFWRQEFLRLVGVAGSLARNDGAVLEEDKGG
ncbi:vWA domain-containing protein [Novosphingobium sp. JCM 18896]|uniref:vWA domain-containing protein n=1 Tax=Novosphingobium sp. JCM 18896 TaxID=2989731 RepID=UPI0022215802|nr:VWA domain-containing protein [Novosphingobium sp. JCM 18896]MCW1428810.1 VWA domain-containing protein [Novosphingobium sp. JCM 18896]